MYFEFDDVRRIHQPYTDGYLRGKYNISLPFLFIYNI